MKIKLLTTLTCLSTILSNGLFAQEIETSKEFEYECGIPYPIAKGFIKSYAAKNGSIISFKMSKGIVNVQKFSGTKITQESLKVYEDLPDGAYYEDDIKTEDFIYLLYSVWDKSTKTEQLYVRAINLSTAEFENGGERVIAAGGKIVGGNGNKFKLAISSDHSKILIYYRKTPESRNDKINKDLMGFYVFDRDLKQVWGNDVEMPYSESRMNNIDYTVDSEGNVFVLSEIMREGEIKRYDRDNNPNFDYQLITFSESGMNIHTSDIDVKGKYVTQVNFFEGKDHALLLAGFYGNVRGVQTDGIFYCSLSKSGVQSDFRSFEIPTELLKQYTSQSAQNKIDKKEEQGGDVGLKYMRLRELNIDSDGNLLFAGEKYFVKSQSDSNTGLTSYTHTYEEIVLARITKDGELAYMKKLPKSQICSSSNVPDFRGEMGYRLVDSKNHYYFLFIDNIKNAQLSVNDIPESYYNGMGGFLTAYQVNKSSGEVRKLSILDIQNAAGYKLSNFTTERIVAVNDNEFALECYLKPTKEEIMIKIKVLE